MCQAPVQMPPSQGCGLKQNTVATRETFVFLCSGPQSFLAARTDFVEDSFSMKWGWRGGWFGDNSSALHLLSPLFLF